MGREARVTARLGDQAEEGRLLHEPPRLIFRGATRRVWPAEALAGVRAEAGELVLADGSRFALGEPQAARWVDAIANPKGRLDKLGVKPGLRVAVSNLDDPDFLAELAPRVDLQPVDAMALDLVFHGVEGPADLAEVARIIPRLGPRGAIWVVALKGAAARVKHVEVFAALRSLGLVDTRVCAFSDARAALRFSTRAESVNS